MHNLYFVYLNKKQNSKTAIASYSKKQRQVQEAISAINLITEAVLDTSDFEDFSSLLQNHEIILSEILEMKTVKERLFSHFNGTVKSLGAWGGDFVLVISKENPTAYFKEKGFETIIPYHQMIL
jgi:hypothetical protein